MSDHVLLAAAVHGGLAAEAVLPLLSWRAAEASSERPGRAGGYWALGWEQAVAGGWAVACLVAAHRHALTALPDSKPPPGRGRAFLRAYCALAGVLAGLVSAECYFTARYFHPPSEILLAAAVGLLLFQAPLLALTARAVGELQRHSAERAPQAAAGAAAKRSE